MCNRGARRFAAGEVVGRARSRLGERRYRILSNNCEHFCTWALRGENRSTQVERLRAIPYAIFMSLRLWWNRSRREIADVGVTRDAPPC